ncbi:MAG: hypothetical protein IKL61_00060 [Clostridia bacterium]|nr:hypothetical protein [Clostridia bacterium]
MGRRPPNVPASPPYPSTYPNSYHFSNSDKKRLSLRRPPMCPQVHPIRPPNPTSNTNDTPIKRV